VETDAVLLRRWREGNREAGEEIFRRHFRSVYQFFERIVGIEADDLVQATFIACLTTGKSFEGDGTLRWYLLGIARHEKFGFFRQRKQQAVAPGLTSLADLATTPATRLARAQAIGHLRAALERLPLDQKMLLTAHYWDEMDASALGVMFEVAPGTIRVRLLRARKSLRAELALVEAEAGPAQSGTDPLSRSVEQPEPSEGSGAEDEDE
jgi:RNA polymerase sigma factor (sigma-70 family)